MDDAPRDLRSIDALLAIMARLRHPVRGCPWDLEQTFVTVAPYTLEEAYEVADAIERNDMGDLKGELGDLLLQVVFHAQMAAEARTFAFADVVEAICEKMISRHPHVFGDERITSAAAQTEAWEAHKQRERAARGGEAASLMDDVPLALPALARALKLQKRAARVGFDWREAQPIMDKLHEEIGELNEAMAASAPKAKLADELGDILFVVANIARHLGIDPEDALRGTNAKFVRRFKHVEATVAARGATLGEVSLDEMEAAWNDAKRLERE
jgi:nucleoside triphosphate diphosphatase